MTRPTQDLASSLLDQRTPPSERTRIVYGVATGANTVAIAGAATAVTLPAIGGVESGDYAAILVTDGGDALILGPLGGDATWTAVSYTNSWTTSGTQTVEYRKIGDMVQVRGAMTGGTLGSSAFTLPDGVRPPQTIRIAVEGTGNDHYTFYSAAGTVTPVGTGNTLHDLGFVQFSTTA